MGHRAGAGLGAATLLALVLVGCNGSERQGREQTARKQAAAERKLDALVSRCRRQQPAVQQQLQVIGRSDATLSQLNQQRYGPLPRPAAPDPAVMARFTRDDQELEQERYTNALARWQEADGAERRRWQAQQEARRQELMARQSGALAALTQLGVADTPEAQAAWSLCDRAQLSAITEGAAR
jgi:hypothetical protein